MVAYPFYKDRVYAIIQIAQCFPDRQSQDQLLLNWKGNHTRAKNLACHSKHHHSYKCVPLFSLLETVTGIVKLDKASDAVIALFRCSQRHTTKSCKLPAIGSKVHPGAGHAQHGNGPDTRDIFYLESNAQTFRLWPI